MQLNHYRLKPVGSLSTESRRRGSSRPILDLDVGVDLDVDEGKRGKQASGVLH